MKRPKRFSIFRDEIDFEISAMYSEETRVLFDIRKYIKLIYICFALYLFFGVVSFSLVWSQISKYEMFHPHNVNAMNDNIQSILRHTDAMSTLAIPIMSNIEFTSNSFVSAISQNHTGRSLLDTSDAAMNNVVPATVTNNDLSTEDYMLRRMIYKQTHALLVTSNKQLEKFDVSSISNTLNWVVFGVNYTGIANRYDRIIQDAETIGKFTALSASMILSETSETFISHLKGLKTK